MEELKLVKKEVQQIINTSIICGYTFDVYGNVENPLFLAKDIALILGHSDVTMMLKCVDEDEKLTQTILRGSQGRLMNMLTENGLYEVLMQSRKPIAKDFKKEVKKILHKIRTEGEYIATNKFLIPQTLSEALYLAASQAKQIEEQNIQLEEQKPKVEFFDQVTDSTDAVDMAQCAKVLNMGIGRNRLFDFLRSRNILDRHNIPYQNFIDLGYFRTIEQKYSKADGTNCINIKTVVYQKGMDYIRKLLNK